MPLAELPAMQVEKYSAKRLYNVNFQRGGCTSPSTSSSCMVDGANESESNDD
jgi:hypothetical protein